jgi:HAMP domain-containing protein
MVDRKTTVSPVRGPAFQRSGGGLAIAQAGGCHVRAPECVLPGMKLLLKFNLVLAVMFAIAVAAIAAVSRDLLQRNARTEIYEAAKLLIDGALAVRDYTSTHIAPLLETQIHYDFRPEMVSAYSANEVLKKLREANPEYRQFVYREATLNPTNPANKAVDWEQDIVGGFRNGTTPVPLFGQRDTPNGRMLFMAKPLKATAACMRCHDTAERAPRTMIAQYGSAAGFGWKVGEVIGAQIVQVPDAAAQARADAALLRLMASLLGVLLAIGAMLNLLIWRMFIRPVTQISALADRISLGDVQALDFEANSRDEIGALALALSRMRRSLDRAMRMLET